MMPAYTFTFKFNCKLIRQFTQMQRKQISNLSLKVYPEIRTKNAHTTQNIFQESVL